MVTMKATIEIPDELYRRAKAKSALEGRAIRDVTEELFRRYVTEEASIGTDQEVREVAEAALLPGETVPAWFGVLRKYARPVRQHDMDAIRWSIARGIAAERDV